MRITDKKSHDQYRLAPLPFFTQLGALFGHVLSDDIVEPHIHVYEHTRFSFDEMSDHPPYTISNETTVSPINGLVVEEEEVLSVFNMKEPNQMLTIIGDVGTGKTNFLRHLCDVHFGNPPFGDIHPIYLDWNGFTASLNDPLPDIYNKFTEEIFNALEQLLSPEEWSIVDQLVFDESKIFSVERTSLKYVQEGEQIEKRADAIREKMLKEPVKFSIERINHICRDVPNKVVIIIDNIDHLRPTVLVALQDFLQEVRLKTIPLVILALRDHTLEKGFSGFNRIRVKPYWRSRIYSPDLQKVVLRRLDYFFPKVIPKNTSKQMETTSGIRIVVSDEKLKVVYRTLLESPFLLKDTYAFVRLWSNYNVRDAFLTLQRIVTYPGLSSCEVDLVTENKKLTLTVDDCITALALGQFKLFYPHRSVVFNAYSAAIEGGKDDLLSGVRILQYLAKLKELVSVSELLEKFNRFGFSTTIISRQINWMAGKDLIWTDAGDPSDVEDDTRVRLSYRGKMYESTLLSRASYNYIMSFNVFSPSTEHPIGRVWKSEFDKEVESIAQIGVILSGDAIGQRVLGLADLLYEAEKEEIQKLRAMHLLNEYRTEISPRSAAGAVLSGLSNFFNAILAKPDKFTRPVEMPS